MWVAIEEACQAGRQPQGRKGGQQADAQHGGAGGDPLGACGGGDGIEGWADFVVVLLAVGGQIDRTGASDKQGFAQVLLKLLHLMAQRALSH